MKVISEKDGRKFLKSLKGKCKKTAEIVLIKVLRNFYENLL